jgi:hypothetical protein
MLNVAAPSSKKVIDAEDDRPSASRRSHKCEPRKPAPPVTSTRVSRCICPADPRSTAANKPMPTSALRHPH